MKKCYVLNILVLALLFSCDYPNQIHYVVSNKTNDSLAVKFTYKTIFLNENSKDSLIVIFRNREDTLFTVGMTSSSVFNPELTDTMENISGIDLFRLSDHVHIKKDIQLKKNWEFIRKGRNEAVLELVINESDF
jgi:hypothetical protein